MQNPQMMKRMLAAVAAAVATTLLAACAALPGTAELDQMAAAMIQSSFRDQGIAKVDRIRQDEGQSACSSDQPPSDAAVARIQDTALKSVKWPADGNLIGDWREGERIAQSGRGLTWTDASAATSANGGNCYNCHQIGPTEISFGTIGPSLLAYGKNRGVRDPKDPVSEGIVKYTWVKLYNSKAYAACSNMPRFGHQGILDEQQIKHLMALLLDPQSPVNR
jgi:L-cysteine S-thiosulfotransferase